MNGSRSRKLPRYKDPGPVTPYDFQALMHRMGGPAKILRGLVRLGYGAPKERTIYRWSLRNSIPAVWLPYVFAVAEANKVMIDFKEEMPMNEIFRDKDDARSTDDDGEQDRTTLSPPRVGQAGNPPTTDTTQGE